MPVDQCKICEKTFYAKPSWIKNGGGKYCSKTCHYQGLKTGKIMTCFICNKKTYKSPKILRKSKSKKYFCSKSCQTKWRNSIFIGEKHANWKHGKSSYRSVLLRNKIPKICRLCGTKDFRVLLVHHIDSNKINNQLKNLTWLCHNCHFLVHHYDEERGKIMVSIA